MLLELLRDERAWVKVSGAERVSASGKRPFHDAIPIARAIVEAAPDRVLWGTDWPHPNMKKEAPDDGVLTDMIPKIAPTEALQRQLLIDNPMRLYWG
jgi:2-pyrone-4,6-dicarboxylate lactonase